MKAHFQLIKSFVWSVLGFDYELSTEYDTDTNAIIQT